MKKPEIPQTVLDIHSAALEIKGEDPVLFDLRGLTSISDYFYIVSGWSERQIKSIQKEINSRLRKKKIRPYHMEGEDGGKWILMDYGDVIVHIFIHETRKYYDLEHLWADAATISLPNDVNGNSESTAFASISEK